MGRDPLSECLDAVEYVDIRFLAYDGGLCKGVRLVGWVVLSGGNDDGVLGLLVGLLVGMLVGENFECCGEGDGE